MSETRKRGPAPKISRDAVLDAARELAPDEVTLAAIGAKLGVTGPALYRYFEDRVAILEALATEARERLVPPDDSLPWDEWLRAAAALERALWKDNPDLYDQAHYRVITRPMVHMSAVGYQVLTKAGFSRLDAFAAMTIVPEIAHSIGYAESHVTSPFDEADLVELHDLIGDLLPPIDLDEMYERSLDVAIDGLRLRLVSAAS